MFTCRKSFARDCGKSKKIIPLCIAAGHDLVALAARSAEGSAPADPTVASATGDPSLDETSTLVARRVSEEAKPEAMIADGPYFGGGLNWFGNRRLLMALAVGGLALLLGVVVLIQTRHGTLVLTVEGPAPVIKVDGEEAKVMLDKDGKTYRIGVKPGSQHTLLVTTPDGIEFAAPGEFSISPGEETRLTARLELQSEPRSGSSLDAFDPAQIPLAERFPWQPKELVAVIGEHRQRHWGAVISMAMRPDGKQVASGGYDGRIRFWDTATRQEIVGLQIQRGFEPARLTIDAEVGANSSATSMTLAPRPNLAIIAAKAMSSGPGIPSDTPLTISARDLSILAS